MKAAPFLKRRGFQSKALTLVELVVVLLILVVLTSVAIQSTEGVVNQGRFEATAKTIQGIEAAILGDSTLKQPDGSPILNGYVADVGRLPESLNDLIVKPAAVLDFDFRQNATDTAVEIGTGWRGPYLRLPLGRTEVRDGYNELFNEAFTLAASSADGQDNLLIQSFGADRAAGNASGDPFSDDQTTLLEGNRYQGIVEVSVNFVTAGGAVSSPTDPVTVRIFMPDGAGGSTFLPAALNTDLATTSFRFENVPVGLRVIRVYEGATPTPLSNPLTILVLPNTTTSKTFTIQN